MSKKKRIEYSPALESSDIVSIKDKNKLFINGKFVRPRSDCYFHTINPSTAKNLALIAEADEKDVDTAVNSARRAYKNSWSQMSGRERGKYLFRIARLIQERARELAVLESMDNGKPIKETRDFDIPQLVANFFYFAGWADKLEYLFNGRGVKALGVSGQIIPWNFPLLMASWKLAPALAAGNCVVLKPSETTSLSALLLAEIIQDSGIPDGVVNIITGAGKTGEYLVKHPDINKIAFTGSTDVGKKIANTIAHTNKKLTLELGGKSAHIIYEDATIDQAVEGVVQGIYFNQGHVCCAGSRLLLEESIAVTFVEKLKDRMTSLRVGDPLDKNTDIGAINSKIELDKIKALINSAKKDGIEYYETCTNTLPKNGYFLKPSFFNNVASSATVYRKEIFGPVLVISTFRTSAEAIQKANDSPYGLAAGIWSEKASKVLETAAGIKAGVVWANSYNKFDPSSPFGGYKESGFGREGGRHGILSYVEVEK